MEDKLDNLVHNEEMKHYSTYFSSGDAAYFKPGQLFVDKNFYHILFIEIAGKEIDVENKLDDFSNIRDEPHYYIEAAIDLSISRWERSTIKFAGQNIKNTKLESTKRANVVKIFPNKPILILNDVAIRIKNVEADKNTFNMFLKVLYGEKIGWVLVAKIEDWAIEPDPMRNQKNFHTTFVKAEQNA